MAEEDLSLTALMEFLNAVEAGIASAKGMIGTAKQVSPMPDFDLMFWETKHGTKGDYQQTSRTNNKVELFERLKAELNQHGGFWQYKGFRYWFHQNDENLIDRRTLDTKTKPKMEQQKTEATTNIDIEKTRQAFPKILESILIFSQDGSHIKIVPRQYLGSENFAKIASIVRELGGEYVSAGKQSHFRVPIKE